MASKQGMHACAVADTCRRALCGVQVQEVDGDGPVSSSTVQRGLPVVEAAAAEVYQGSVDMKVRHTGGSSLYRVMLSLFH
jgi:hypothetical protein